MGPAPGPPRARHLPAAAAELGRRGPETMRHLPRARLLALQLALLVASGAPEAPLSAPRSLVWGPGLQAGVVLPVRYFYLQAVSSEGQNLTRSPPGSVRPRASPALRPLRASPPLVPASTARPSPGTRPPPAARAASFPRLWSPPLLLPSQTQRLKGVATQVY